MFSDVFQMFFRCFQISVSFQNVQEISFQLLVVFFHRFQVQCRPLSISMGNGIRFIKRLISSTRDLSDDDTRIHLITSIDEFIDKRIKLADELIIRNLLGLEPHTTAKIVDGDVVLTHGRSHVVEQAIKYASSINITFRVVVVDSRPRMEGRGLGKQLPF